MRTHSERGAAEFGVFDAHCDTLSLIADGTDADNCAFTACGADTYGSYTQVFACFISPRESDCAMERFMQIAGLFDELDFGKTKKLLSVEGADMIRCEEDVDILYSRGVRCIALTWNHSNRLAGGADDETQGITELGRRVIRRMEDVGILLDVSHLNDRSFYDAVSVSSRPIIATHSNSRAVCHHPRNLTDEMFRLIRGSGGCVGVNLYPPFLTGSDRARAADAAAHVLHWAELGGIDAVGIGADFDGTDGLLPQDIRGCGELYRLMDLLSERGMSAAETELFSYKNFERVFGIGEEKNA